MKSGEWRETPPYDADEREERAKAHCKTWQKGHHIDTLAKDSYREQKPDTGWLSPLVV